MKFVSFFAGIGGIDLGLERAGHECVGQVEINPFCQKVLAKHWPDTWRHDDITTLRAEDIPGADLWAGGFPCQDISTSGKRAGIHGERSGLFFDWMRLVREIRPGYLLLENVAALLHNGMGDVLGELAAGGYDAEWSCLPACDVGAPHRRDRVFVIANAPEKRPIASAKGVQAKGLPREFGGVPWREGIFRMDQPPVVGDRDGLPAYFHRNEALGNAVVPAVAEYIGRLLMEADK